MADLLASVDMSQKDKIKNTILKVFQEVLKKQEITFDDNFFDIGGNSIKALILVSNINTRFNTKLLITDLFENRTIENISQVVLGKVNNTSSTEDTIPRADRKELYDLSPAQKQIWVLCQLGNQGSIAYNVPYAILIKGQLNNQAITESFKTMVWKHEILRTNYITSDSEPKQIVNSFSDINFDIPVVEIENTQENLNSILQNASEKPFNLTKDLLVKLIIYKLFEDEYILFLNIHHIVCDGWSVNIFMRELLTNYENYLKNDKKIDAEILNIQYKDYSEWLNKKIGNNEFEKERLFWLKKFNEISSPLELPFKTLRPTIKSYKGKSVRWGLESGITNEIRNFAKQRNITLFVVFTAIIKLLLYKYTNKNDITVGTISYGRYLKELQDHIGLFINILPLRTKFDEKKSFDELLSIENDVILEAFKHEGYPFDMMIKELGIKRDIGRFPLFDVLVVFNQEVDFNKNVDSSINMELLNVSNSTSKFDLSFHITESKDDMKFTLEYNTDLIADDQAARIKEQFSKLIEQSIIHSKKTLIELDYIPEAQKKEIQKFYKGDHLDFNCNNVLELFYDQVNKQPKENALIFNESILTYEQLDRKVESLALMFSEFTVNGKNKIVIMLDRGLYNVICMLAIMRIGACYVPLNSKLPKKRKDYIIKDLDPALIIVEHGQDEKYSNSHSVLSISHIENSSNKAMVELNTIPSNEAYIIYTSGSTGTPKGVIQTNNTLVNLINWQIEKSGIESNQSLLQFSSFSFDVSIQDVLFTLCSGGTLHIMDDEKRNDYNRLSEYIVKNKIEILSLPSSILRNYFNSIGHEDLINNKIEHIITAGEQLYIDDNLNFFLRENPSLKLHNHYGPSETHVVTSETISSSYKNINLRPSIGKPLPNSHILILDDNYKLLPVSLPGKIYIGGKHLFSGYLNNEELTREKIIDNPFDHYDKLYDSGDIGRWNSDGTIEFIGRIDDQIKLRGYRIELSEIEQILLRKEDINQVVVTTFRKESNIRLVAYIKGKTPLDKKQILSYLKDNLPEYSIPELIIVDSFPLNVNGKVDKSKLPTPEFKNKDVEIILPENEHEEELYYLWKEVLMSENFGTLNNFFDLGGNSIDVISIISRFNKKFTLNIGLSEFYENPTIRSLTNRINAKSVTNSLTVNFNQGGNNTRNLFLIPPVIGIPFIFNDLVTNLKEEFNCYGFQYLDLVRNNVEYDSIDKIAMLFTEELLNKQAEDKIYLLGYSMGGLIAYEMSKMLSSKGKELVLILIDSNESVIDTDDFKTKYGDRINSLINQEMRIWKNYYSEEDFDKTRKALLRNTEMYLNYRQNGKTNSYILALEAEENEQKTKMEKWKKFNSGRTMHKFVKGNHHTILNPANSNDIAELLKEIIP